MDNLKLYEKVRKVPDEAKKTIGAGRLKGMTDINPMWRIKTLTEQFGVCGFGWKYEITDKRLSDGANGEISAFIDINLYIKLDGEWSEAIPGTGGSSFVASERNGLHTSDECFKMALTDALSVACKALGFGADVYFSKDMSKYDDRANPAEFVCADCGKPFEQFEYNGKKFSAKSAFNASAKKCEDGKARCKECRIKAGYPA